MDIYSLLNSRDIAAHCREIGHPFTAVEAAFIVHESQKLTLREKHDAYREIIATMPDTEVPARLDGNGPHHDSLHALLRVYMDAENSVLAMFCEDTPATVYRLNEYHHRIFPTYAGALVNLKAEEKVCKEKASDERRTYTITKNWLDADDRYICVQTTPDGEPIQCTWAYPLCREYDQASRFFTGLWIKIPTPFQVGDLVVATDAQTPYGASFYAPFVLTAICYWNAREDHMKRLRESAASSDMTAYGYWLMHDGMLLHECMHAYHHLEYYRGELSGHARILTALGHHEKGNISTDLLLNAHSIMLLEGLLNSSRDFASMWYTEEGLSLVVLRTQ